MRKGMNRWMFAVLVAVLAMNGPAMAQSGEKMDEKAMMEAYMKLAEPGEPHKMLASVAGSWNVDAKMWMAPGQPPTLSKGTAEVKVVLGGRYVEEHFNGDFGGMPFSGVGMTGYDNVKKQYVSTWIDTYGTGILMLHGKYDPATKTYTYEGDYPDPLTGQTKTFRSVARTIDANKHVAEMFDKQPDGQWFKMMELTYTRK